MKTGKLLSAIAALSVVLCCVSGCKKSTKACFEFPSTVAVYDTVRFTNCTKDGLVYNWNFGDSATSNLANPVHVYKSIGTRQVTLIVYGENKTTARIEEINVTGPSASSVAGTYWGGTDCDNGSFGHSVTITANGGNICIQGLPNITGTVCGSIQGVSFGFYDQANGTYISGSFANKKVTVNYTANTESCKFVGFKQ